MKHLFSTVVFFIVNCCVAFSQSVLTGRVTDASQKGIPFADIRIWRDGVQSVHVLSDSAGYFQISPLKSTGAKLEVSAVGWQKLVRQLAGNEQELQLILTPSAYLLPPLEVTSVRASDRAPFTKSEISKTDIEKVNLGQDLPFVLNQMPSVIINSDAGNGIGYTGIRVRGSDGGRTNVTINGIPYNDAESQGSYFVDIPDVASSAQSIQVQRGVGTSTNGAGAFGASININTNEIHENAYAVISNSYGSFNSWKNTVNAGTGLLHQHWYADVRLSHISSDGYIRRATSDLQSLLFSTGYVSDNTSVRFNLITGKEKTYQAWNGVPEYMIGTDRRYNEVGYIGTDANGKEIFYDNQTDNYVQTHYQLFVTQKFNPFLSLNINSFLSRGKGYYEEYKSGAKYTNYGLSAYVPFPGDTVSSTDLIRQKWLDNYFYGQTFALEYSKGGDELTLGGSWTQYDGKHYGIVKWSANGGVPNDYKYYGDFPAHKYDQNVYLKWTHGFDNYWNLFADAQYRHVRYKINGDDDDFSFSTNADYNFFNPKIGISYIRNGYNAYASFAIAQKEPGRSDMVAAETAPRSERLNDWEVGISKTEKKYNWGATFYYMNYKDQLVLTGRLNSVGSAIRVNVPSSYRMGIELQGGYVFASWFNANANIAWSRNKIKSFTSYWDEYDNDSWDNWLGQQTVAYKNTDISFSPNIVSSTVVNFLPLKQLEISAIGKFVGKQYLDNTQNDTRKLNDYYSQDFRVTYTLHPKSLKEISIIGYVYNAFNKMYNTNGASYAYWVEGNTEPTNYNYYFPMSGTRYTIGVNIKL